MRGKRRVLFAEAPLVAALALAVCMALGSGSASATVQYLDDGALPNASGGWDLPPQGTCPADVSKATRPDCLALRLAIVQGSCVAPNYSWTTSGVCNDLVNTTQLACEAAPDRFWNAATGVCAIVMKGDDRNNIVCALHSGTWVVTGTCTGVWVMPARTAYTPNLLTGNSAGDQCLRCHNADTQYNGPRIRDTENFLYSGHKNMARKVTVGLPRGGPPFSCTNPLYTDEQACEENGAFWDPTIYPSDDGGNTFDWMNGQIVTSGGARDLTWIYGDWLAPLPRAIYKAPASTTDVCSDPRYTTTTCVANGGVLIKNAGASYSCSRCHTTGATSDAAINGGAGIEGKEPELSFPGITWDRLSDAPANVVNLSWGVKDDPNKYASWDVFGIVCTRCHNSAIDTTTGTGSPPQYSAPTGMSSHHNNLTVPDISSGTCTDPRWTAEAQCTSAGGQWLTACSVNPTAGVCTMAANTLAKCGVVAGTWVPVTGFCSVAYYTNSVDCLANSPTVGSANTWTDGYCTTADAEGACTGGAGDGAKTWRRNGSLQSCLLASATWSFGSCSLPGICNTLDPAHNTKALCEAALGQWNLATDIVRCLDVHEYGKDNSIAAYTAAGWTGNHTNRGQIITRLCMDCHRQETTGMPYANSGTSAGTLDTVNPGTYVKVGPAHGTVAPVSHPHGNMFLNSPHGYFYGTFNQIATAKLGTGYDSGFLGLGEAANTGNGCTGCHDVHESVVEATSPFPAIHEECTECHSNPDVAAPQVDLAMVNHLGGAGTPLEHMGTEPAKACEICHMPGGLHMWRINPSASYSTYPPAALTATVNANAADHNGFPYAVWVDVDGACGQCHGGGSAQASATGSIDTTTKYCVAGTNDGAPCTAASECPSGGSCAAAKTLLVSGVTGSFTTGSKITIPGAGALEGDGVTRGDFESYVVSAPGTKVTLAGAVSAGVSGVPVVQNPTKNGAFYRSKATLALVAKGMHDGAAVSYAVTFSITPSGLTADVSASVGCSVGCPTFAYDWDWGDGMVHGSGQSTSHGYLSAGTKSITLTVTADGKVVGSVTRSVTLTAPDLPPTASATCTWNPDTWTMTVVDTSTDADATPVQKVVVDWGDSSGTSIGAPLGTLNHTYVGTAGPYTVTLKAIDTALKASTLFTCPVTATPAKFSISGTVYASDGVTPLASAAVTVKKGATAVKTVYTASNGTFTAGSLKPGTYTLRVSKYRYTFAVPAATITIGPDSSGNNISATAP